MKKVIFLFFILFCIKVNATEKTFIEYEYIDNVYYNGYVNGQKISYNAMYMEHDSNPLYCLGFGIPISKQLGYSEYNFYNYPDYEYEKKVYIEIIAYFGYGYNYNYDINYYLAAQELIWNSLGIDMYWTRSLNGTDIIDLTPYKNIILRFYNEHISEEPISIENYSMEVGNSYFIEDPNVYLNPYTYWYYGNNEVIQTSEGIMINALYKGQESIHLIRHIGAAFPSELFIEPGYQPVLKPGHTQSVNRFINIDVKNSSIQFARTNITEKPNLKNNYLKLDNAVYELYDIAFNYLTTFTTDEEGKAIIDDLPMGSYKVKEITPSYGYSPFSEYVCTSIHMGNAPGFERLYAYPILKKLSIENIYKIDGVEYKDQNINFEIYRDDYLIGTFSTDNMGKIQTELEYGVYNIKQINSKEGFDVEPQFNVIINESENNLDFLFIKEKNTNPKIIEEKEENNVQIPNDETTTGEKEPTANKDESYIEETKITNQEEKIKYEDTVNIEIYELPQLNSIESIWEIICVGLLSLLHFYYY